MPLPTWGVAVIALYCLLQIPAVLFLARYCEVEAEDLPTPPTRTYWQGEEGSENAQSARASEEPVLTEDPNPSTTPATTADSGSAPPVETAGRDRVRCRHCGATNDPSFSRCRRCVAQL